VIEDTRNQLQQTLGAAYTLERELGGGGMSRVFVADEARLDRKVVVKLLSPELAAGVNVERFEREIRVAASLQQANIVPIFSAGDSQGLPYYTMPFVEGESLRARLAKDGVLTFTEIVRILGDVARALAHAHERGVVHRDIKPDNVLLSGGTAVVTDFGIAKALSASRTESSGATLTQLGTTLGTPAYMAPEQAAGDPDVDHRADIYAFGCMAYELLAGQPPFHGRTPSRVLAAHMGEAPQPVTELRPDTPSVLADLVMSCLAKDAASRPASAAELMRVLDSVHSAGGMTAMPPILLGGKAILGRALAIYAAAFIVVAVVARAAIVSIGLPSWVFPGALIVMALGLPVVLFTGYVHRATHRALTATPGGSKAPRGTLATIAVKASPHVSWRRTALGGAYAIGAFILIVGGFMLLRALGIGPAGSLMAAGRLEARDRVLIADFRVSGADSTLGGVIAEAVRANLAQSSAVTLVSPSSVAAALRRMQRPDTSALTLAMAREVAAREGIKAVVDGDITAVGNGFVMAIRLVTADSATPLASFRASVGDLGELIPTVDDLSRKLRGKMGESLRSVQGAPPLAQVTTSSLEALRKFTEGNRANNVEANFPKALALLREAVSLDSGFAMAWRHLANVSSNAGQPQSQIDSAITIAYRLRHRLTEPEQLLATFTYFNSGPGRDRAKALAAVQRLLEFGDSLWAINAALLLMNRREYARAESMFLAAERRVPDVSLAYASTAIPQFNLGKVREAEATSAEFKTRFPNAAGHVQLSRSLLYHRGDLVAYERSMDSARASSNLSVKAPAAYARSDFAVLNGRLRDGTRFLVEARATDSSRGLQRNTVFDSVDAAYQDAWFFGNTDRAVRRLDAVLASSAFQNQPVVDRPWFFAGAAYALAGRPDKARAVLDLYTAAVRDTAQRRDQSWLVHRVMAEIALAEKRPRDAIVEFRKGDMKPDGPVDVNPLWIHFALGRAFDAANEPDSAIAHFEQYLQTPHLLRAQRANDPTALAGISKRLGELYEARREYAKAAAYYQKFVTLWKDADPELQPRVAEVRQRLARLRDLERR
jgi:tRNA A-37 threonylcarbamoyl transferase component Bud32/tetratricopeptide (TPR) repeat protein